MSTLNPYLLKAELLQKDKDNATLRKAIAAQENVLYDLKSQNATLRNQLNQSKQRSENELEFLVSNLRLQIDYLYRQKLDLKQAVEKRDYNKYILTILANLNAQGFKKEERYIVQRYTQYLYYNNELERQVEQLKTELEHVYARQAESAYRTDKKSEYPAIEPQTYATYMQECAQKLAKQLRNENSQLETYLQAMRAQLCFATQILRQFWTYACEKPPATLVGQLYRICVIHTAHINTIEALKIELEQVQDENNRLRKAVVNEKMCADNLYTELRTQRENSAAIISKLETCVRQLNTECGGRANEVIGLQVYLEQLKQQLKGGLSDDR